jgi:hypothetical protein
MSKGSLLRLRVLDSNGNPIEGSRLLLESAPGPYPDISALSDTQGEVSIRLPERGQYGIACHADGYAPAHLDLDASAEEISRTIVLQKGT